MFSITGIVSGTGTCTPTGRRRNAPVAGRLLVCLHQPAPVPIHPGALVFPDFHLGALSLAKFAAGTQSYAGAPRPCRGPLVSRVSSAVCFLLLAHGALLAGLMANPIFFAGAKLTDYRMEIIGGVSVLMLIVLGPLLSFSHCLMRAKRTGLREYGRLASRYVTEFDRKWVRGGANADEPLLASGDIQSLADLGNSFQVIRDIRPFPFGRDTVIQLVIVFLLPVAPLVLTMIPLEELIKRLVVTVL